MACFVYRSVVEVGDRVRVRVMVMARVRATDRVTMKTPKQA